MGPGVPEYSINYATTCIPSDELLDPHILISDFGEAFMADEGPSHQLHTPLLLCPPEMIFANATTGKPADVWSLACTIFDIMGEQLPFEGWMPDRDDVAAEMVSALGLPPSPWWQGWGRREDFFLQDGTWNVNPKRWHDPIYRPLKERIKHNGRVIDSEFTAEEEVVWIELLRGMLVYEPDNRMTIHEALGSTWMREYGTLNCNSG